MSKRARSISSFISSSVGLLRPLHSGGLLLPIGPAIFCGFGPQAQLFLQAHREHRPESAAPGNGCGGHRPDGLLHCDKSNSWGEYSCFCVNSGTFQLSASSVSTSFRNHCRTSSGVSSFMIVCVSYYTYKGKKKMGVGKIGDGGLSQIRKAPVPPLFFPSPIFHLIWFVLLF